MKNFFSNIIAMLGLRYAHNSYSAKTPSWFFDEEECPKSLIK